MAAQTTPNRRREWQRRRRRIADANGSADDAESPTRMAAQTAPNRRREWQRRRRRIADANGSADGGVLGATECSGVFGSVFGAAFGSVFGAESPTWMAPRSHCMACSGMAAQTAPNRRRGWRRVRLRARTAWPCGD